MDMRPASPGEIDEATTRPSAASFQSVSRSLSRAQEQLETSKGSLDKLIGKVNSTSANITELQNQISILRGQLAAKFQELDEYQDLIPIAEGEVGRAKARVERLEDCARRVEKEMRIEAWIEEMENEDENTGEFAKYLHEVGRAPPDSVASVSVLDGSPEEENISDTSSLASVNRHELHDALRGHAIPQMANPNLMHSPLIDMARADSEQFRPMLVKIESIPLNVIPTTNKHSIRRMYSPPPRIPSPMLPPPFLLPSHMGMQDQSQMYPSEHMFQQQRFLQVIPPEQILFDPSQQHGPMQPSFAQMQPIRMMPTPPPFNMSISHSPPRHIMRSPLMQVSNPPGAQSSHHSPRMHPYP